MEDKVEFYTKIIVDLMIKYKELFPVVETLYKGSEHLKNIGHEGRIKLLNFEVRECIGLKEHIRHVINTPFYVSLFLVSLPKQFKWKFDVYQRVIDQAVCHTIFSIYIHTLTKENLKVSEKMMSEI